MDSNMDMVSQVRVLHVPCFGSCIGHPLSNAFPTIIVPKRQAAAEAEEPAYFPGSMHHGWATGESTIKEL
jgi:hypothetical protein